MDTLDDKDSSKRSRTTVVTLILLSSVFFFVAWPPLTVLLEDGIRGAFKFFASDSFYYLAIAQQSSSIGNLSFDGIHPTNGFHPLWTVYLHSANSFAQLDQEQMIFFAAISSILLAATGTALFSWAVFRMTQRFAIALLASVPGLFYLLMPHFGKEFAAQWNFANSMESPLSVFLFGSLLIFLATGSRQANVLRRRDLSVLSVLLAAIVLTRLDDVFILVPFGVYAFYSGRSAKDRILRSLSCLLVPALTLSAYLLFNQIYAGHFLPMSGMAKADPGQAFLRNAYATYTTLFPFLDFMRIIDNGVWKAEGWRVIQMLVPAILAGVWLYRFRYSTKTGMETLPKPSGQKVAVVCLASYVIIKSVYNFCMVSLWDQGNWYYAVSLMTSNLILALFVTEVLDRARSIPPLAKQKNWLYRHGNLISGTAALLLVLLVVNAATDQKQNGKKNLQNYHFWLQRHEAQSLIDKHCPSCGIVSFDDGIVAFSLKNVSTMNGIGLALDAEARTAYSQGQLLDIAWERGHRLLVTVNYRMAPNAYRRNEALRANIRRNSQLKGQSLENWNFELAFEVPGIDVNFIQFSPRSWPTRVGMTR